MDEAIQRICEEADTREREILVRQISMLERLTMKASYITRIIPEEENSKTNKEKNECGRRKQSKERRERIISYLENHPQSTVEKIAQELDLSPRIAGTILGKMGEKLYNEVTTYSGKIRKKYSLV